MQTYAVHFGVRVTQHDQNFPTRDLTDTLTVRMAATQDDALDLFCRQLNERLSDRTMDARTVTQHERLELLVRASRLLEGAAIDAKTWPAQILLEDSNDFGMVTGRVWLAVTEWADSEERVEVPRAD